MEARKSKIYTVRYRRKRSGKTNYRKRLSILKGRNSRLVIRKSLKNIMAQLVKFNPKGDEVVLSVNSRELLKYGYKMHRGNLMAAYLVGLLIGKKANKANLSSANVDLGLQPSTKGSVLYAVVKGAIDAGLKIPCSAEILPPEDRIKGKHIEDYAKKISSDKEMYQKQFSSYIKNNIDPKEISKSFESVKNNILKGVN